jgi:hypothetical protein
VEAVLTQAQEYSKPFLEEHFKKELKPHFKQQYTNDLLGKLAQSSGGLLKTTEAIELGDLKKAADLLTQRIKDSAGKPDAEKDKMIEDLNAKITKMETDHADAIETLQKDFSAKEEARNTQSAALDYFGKKSLAVTPQVASKGVLAALQEKYLVKWNPEAQKFELYDKANPTSKAKKSGTAFASFDEEAEAVIAEYNWTAKSKGGGGKSKEEIEEEARKKREQSQGGQDDKGKRKSRLGSIYEKAEEAAE